MVGRLALNQKIGVRFPVRQQIEISIPMRYADFNSDRRIEPFCPVSESIENRGFPKSGVGAKYVFM